MKLIIVLCFLLASVIGQECDCQNPIRVGALNTYQNPVAPYREERYQAMVEYFMDTESNPFDVLCLSDLWTEGTRNRVIQDLDEVFPDAATSTSIGTPRSVPAACPEDEEEPACSDEEIQNVLRCALINDCLEGGESNAVQCAIENCGQQLNGVSDSCSSCLAITDEFGAEDRMVTCTANRRNQEGQISACQFGYGGDPDLAILSKWDILSTATYHYNVSPYSQWTALWARIDTPTMGPVNFICSHIVPDLRFVNTSDENYAQIQELIQWVRQRDPGYSGMNVLFGDFNVGPQTETTGAHLSRGYNYIIQQGFADTVFKTQNDGDTAIDCTFCTDTNTLAAQVDTGKRWALDHVFVNEDANVCIPRALVFANEDNTATVVNPEGDEIDVPISYHYGFGAYMCPSNDNIGESPQSPVADLQQE